MIPTWPITNLPIPQHIVVINGVWLDRENVESALSWVQARLENATGWERKYLRARIDLYKQALAA